MKHSYLLAMLPLAVQPAAAEMFGRDYTPCGDQPTTVAIVECIDGKTQVWDQRLNTAYKSLAQRVDAAQREPLRAAQRLWIQFRDANCRFYASQDGSIRQIQAAECLRALTQDRALELDKAMKFD